MTYVIVDEMAPLEVKDETEIQLIREEMARIQLFPRPAVFPKIDVRWSVFIKPPLHWEACLFGREQWCGCAIGHDHFCMESRGEIAKRKRIMDEVKRRKDVKFLT